MVDWKRWPWTKDPAQTRLWRGILTASAPDCSHLWSDWSVPGLTVVRSVSDGGAVTGESLVVQRRSCFSCKREQRVVV